MYTVYSVWEDYLYCNSLIIDTIMLHIVLYNCVRFSNLKYISIEKVMVIIVYTICKTIIWFPNNKMPKIFF